MAAEEECKDIRSGEITLSRREYSGFHKGYETSFRFDNGNQLILGRYEAFTDLIWSSDLGAKDFFNKVISLTGIPFEEFKTWNNTYKPITIWLESLDPDDTVVQSGYVYLGNNTGRPVEAVWGRSRVYDYPFYCGVNNISGRISNADVFSLMAETGTETIIANQDRLLEAVVGELQSRFI